MISRMKRKFLWCFVILFCFVRIVDCVRRKEYIEFYKMFFIGRLDEGSVMGLDVILIFNMM